METKNINFSIQQIVKRVSQKLTMQTDSTQQFYIPFNKDLIFQVNVRILKNKYFIFRAILCYKNLLSVEIPKMYIKTLSNMIKNYPRRQFVTIPMIEYYGIKFDVGQLFFQFKGHLFQFKTGQKQFQISVQKLLVNAVTGFSNTLNHVGKCLQKIGILKMERENTLVLQKMEKSFKSQIISILKSEGNFRKVQEETKCQPDMQQEPSSNNWQIVDKISQKDISQTEKSQVFKGGYCRIEKKICNIYRMNCQMNTEQQQKLLAVKTINQLSFEQKLSNQKRIVQQIGVSEYILNYYQQKRHQNVIYMDYCQNTLGNFISRDYNTIEEIISISIEFVKAVIHLHQKGVVHRDLKPSNILLAKNNKQLKIIDFGQSTLVSDEFRTQSKLGSTVPYSAIQCISHSTKGFNSTFLDNWSVGINLFELMFKKLPLSYTRSFNQDILKGWENELMIPFSKLKKSGLRLLEDVYNIITIKLIKFNQESRLSLQKVLLILQLSQNYLRQIINFINC